MKPMNYLLTIVSLLFVAACSNPSDTQNKELESVKSSSREMQEGSQFMEIYLHDYFLDSELIELNCLKDFQMAEVEAGNEAMAPELERTLIQIGINGEQHEIVDDLIAKLCPKAPQSIEKCPKPKPNPCTQEKGCQFTCPIVIPELLDIWVPIDDVDDFDIRYFGENGDICGEVVDITEVEGSDGLAAIKVQSDGCCGGFLEITKRYEHAESGEITYSVPVVCE